MIRGLRHRRYLTGAAVVLILIVALPYPGAASSETASDLISYCLSDTRAVFVFDHASQIDWPVLYYLNDVFGCRVDLITLAAGASLRRSTTAIEGREIYLHRCHLPDDSSLVDTVLADLFRDRLPDIVLFGDRPSTPLSQSVRRCCLQLAADTTALFRLAGVFVRSEHRAENLPATRLVVLNSRELLGLYRQRIEHEVPNLFPGFVIENARWSHLTAYRTDRLTDAVDTTFDHGHLLSGVETMRLPLLIEASFPTGPVRETHLKHAERFLGSLHTARTTGGRQQADLVIGAYRELADLSRKPQIASERRFPHEYYRYLADLRRKLENVVLETEGIRRDGQVVLRDSPHGLKLKYTVAVTVDGPRSVDLTHVAFYPFWDTTVLSLDTGSHRILPHQSYVREFLIDVNRAQLESARPESLLFAAEFTCGSFPIVLNNSLPLRPTPPLSIRFEPGFFFVPPVERLDVDRVVAGMYWNVVITKPPSYSGKVRIDLQTPRGVFAGAYKQELDLKEGDIGRQVQIPFTISNLFEPGLQTQTVDLLVDGEIIAADTGIIRIAQCRVPDTVTIAFLPDTTGLLEDLLRMSGADFEPLTDRFLSIGTLAAYDVIIIGSGAHRAFPSLEQAKDRLEEYVRWGGSLVVLGQPRDWPHGLLPVSFVPADGTAPANRMVNRKADSRLLRQPYRIEPDSVAWYLNGHQPLSDALMSPAEIILATSSGSSLLSVSRLGEGRVIFCGLPLVEMVSKLNLQAIHLFANILNY